MAIRNIITSENELLRKKSKPVKVFDNNLWILLDDMYETMVKANGCGIAAIQVGVLKRAVIVETNGLKLELINPEIVTMKGKKMVHYMHIIPYSIPTFMHLCDKS